MEGFDFLSESQWQPLAELGFVHSFFNIDRTTIINTWFIILIIGLFGCFCRYVFSRQQKHNLLFHTLIAFVRAFYDITVQSLGLFSFHHFSFVTSLFIYIILCNSISLVPGSEEPTRNLNTTLALSLISFFYVQYYTIVVHGLKAYIKEYFDPIFIMLPLNIVGKFASIISMAFRLFGNIFGGSTIATIYFSILHGSTLFQTIGLLSGINLIVLLFFGLFEGAIQAFVFAMLTITYLSIAISSEHTEKPIGKS